MKRTVLTLVLLLVSVALWGQYAGVAKRSGVHIKLDGERLTKEQQVDFLSDIDGMDYNEAWSQAARKYKTGVGLTVGGCAVGAAGFFTLSLGAMVSVFGASFGGAFGAIGGEEAAQQGAQKGADAGTPYIVGGMIASVAGLTVAVSGITLISVGGTRMRRITATYNATNRPAAQLYIGPTGSGVGLALRF